MNIRNLLVCLLAAALVLPAQQAPAPPPPAPGPKGEGFEIVVIEGEGAKNSVRGRTGTAPVVEVRENGQPVEGAEVVFQLPPVGPSANFFGWLKNQTAKTDAQGRAIAGGYAPNSEEGRFNIKVTATKGTKSASAIIAQSNVSGSGASVSGGKSHKGMWVAIGVGAAAALAAGIAVAATGDDNGTTTAKVPITIGAGPVTVAGPK